MALLTDFAKAKAQAVEDDISNLKPVFLSKKQREELALKRIEDQVRERESGFPSIVMLVRALGVGADQ